MKTILVVILLVIHTALAMVAGFYTGVHETHREAYKNGLMTIQRDGDRRHYRWIETHKLGYDYDR